MDLEKLLRDNGLKVTKQRLELLSVIDNIEECTIKNIQDMTSIDKSTVYRIIELFLKKGLIEAKLSYINEVYYEIKKHSHYIKCIKCHRKVPINFCPIENICMNGFEIVNHKIEIEGICVYCKRK